MTFSIRIVRTFAVLFIIASMQQLFLADAQAAIPSQEHNALIDLYNSTKGAIWANNTGWLGSPGTECSWYGVTCDASQDHVTMLTLSSNLLSGSIPSSLSNLQNLQYLQLGNNELSGGIPASLGNVASLIDLELGLNPLGGVIPAELGNLVNLQCLVLSGSQLNGNIPPALGNLVNLQYLALDYNGLSGSIPSSLGNLVNLGYLCLWSNFLSGSIPSSVGNLGRLYSLDLRANLLSASIPSSLGNLSNLTSLRLSANQLSGDIPMELTSLSALSDLDISYNALYASDQTLITFLNGKQAGWASTQTVAPGGVSAVAQSSSSILVSWTPIAYGADAGRYEVYQSTASGGPYALAGSTSSKYAASLLLTGLNPATQYYIVVQAVTDPNPQNQNSVASEYSSEVFATTMAAITITTNPAGLSFTADGTAFTTSHTFSWVVGGIHTISTTTPQGAGGTRYAFSSWSDGGAISHTITTPGGATTYTATFITQYQLTTSASPASEGIVVVNPTSSDGFYNSGALVQVVAGANTGYLFSGWSGDLTGSTNTQWVTMSAPRSVTANFSLAPTDITITTTPLGQTFTVDGVPYYSAQTFSWVPGSSHTTSTTTPQGAGGTRYAFSNWSDGGLVSHTIITPSVPTTYTANFTTQYLLTNSIAPPNSGVVSVNPTSPDGYYTSGTTVQLTATANRSYVFSGWSGGLTGSTSQQSLTISIPLNVTATFAPNGPSTSLLLSSGGAALINTAGTGSLRTGYANVTVNSGSTPYGTAVFSLTQNGVVVSEAGVPASPPTTSARIFIDYRTGVNAIPSRSDAGIINVNTGIAIVDYGAQTANVTYTLRDPNGSIIATGHGTVKAGNNIACFIDQLTTCLAPDFNLPADFTTATQFGSLDISGDQPLSVLAMRGTNN